MASDLRILFLINSLDAGGAERFCIALANELSRRDHEVILATFNTAGVLAGGLAAGVELRELNLPRRIRVRELGRLRQAIRGIRPQVMHGFLDNANRWGLIASRLERVPAVVSSMQNVYAHSSPRQARIDRFAFRFADAGIACSPAVEQFYTESWRFPAEKLQTLPNAVDVDSLPCRDESLRAEVRAELGLAPDQLASVTVASLGEQKGHRYLIDAIARIRDDHPTAHWYFVGRGVLRDQLVAQIEDQGLTEQVTLLGLRDDVPRLLQGMDLFVLPSLWEGLSLAALEAAACGLPVLATEVSGSREIVATGETGWIVPPGDSEALAEALREALAEPAALPELGRAGRRKVEAEFSIGVVTTGVEQLYRAILARRA